MEVSENSLVNLIPGRKPGVGFAGRDLVVAAIAAAIEPDFSDDDEVRFHLGKVWDFAVTEAVRAEVIQRKALQIYEAFFSLLTDEIVNGRPVLLNGFATFEKIPAEDGWEVGVERGSNAYRVILPTDQRVSERRVAEIMPGGWNGEGLNAEYIGGPGERYAEGTTTEYNASTGVYTVINGSVVKRSGEFLGIKSGVQVTALGNDGVSRSYAVGGFSVVVWVERQLRPIVGSDDLQLWYLPVADQEARVAAERIGMSAEYIAANLGKSVPMIVSEWLLVVGRVLADVVESNLSWEFFEGLKPVNILPAYPRVRSIVRWSGRVFEVRRIPPEIFKAHFGYQEDYLRSINAWPERSRNTKARIKVTFRKEVVLAVQ